jgi:hypothetical protein
MRSSIEKWKRAVVHLEGATDSEHHTARYKRTIEMFNLLNEGKISRQEVSRASVGGSRDIRYQGTAIYVKHEGRRFLVTARHVIWDEDGAKKDYEAAKAESYPSEFSRRSAIDYAAERASRTAYAIIFRVPSFDELTEGRMPQQFLMNLTAGTYERGPYTFSPTLDLAVISLDIRYAAFANELDAAGYEAVPSADFSGEPEYEGQEIFTIGFPMDMALLGQLSESNVYPSWSSNDFSLPVTTFGRVAMLYRQLEFFWADMSAYRGNSGGPVVANNQCVGVVVQQATTELEDVADNIDVQIPFAKALKASFAREVLQQQWKKDENRNSMFGAR